VLILDEPTAGLDPQGRKTVMELIERYRRETGAAVIFVSHSMEHIASIADRVLVMNQGKVELFDTVSNVFSQYTRLKELGLNIPAVTEIFLRLKEQGIDVGKGIYTVDEGVKALSQLCEGRMRRG
jgi:energy-coupling factor transport system ATP-binding protein